jgi:hypothetical protein
MLINCNKIRVESIFTINGHTPIFFNWIAQNKAGWHHLLEEHLLELPPDSIGQRAMRPKSCFPKRCSPPGFQGLDAPEKTKSTGHETLLVDDQDKPLSTNQ